jgi:hypothetical protein
MGESLFIPRDEVACIQTLRNVVTRINKKHGLGLSVHDNIADDEVEVSRPHPSERSTAPSKREVRESASRRVMTREEMRQKIAEIQAQLDAED